MASAFRSNLCAAFGALIVALAPQTGLAEFADVDLSKLRMALRSIETDIKAGLEARADISAYWATLPLYREAPVEPNASNGAFAPLAAPKTSNIFGSSVQGMTGALDNSNRAIASAPALPAQNDLFSAQLPSSAPAIPVTAPRFEAPSSFTDNTAQEEPDLSERSAQQDVETGNFRLMLATLSQTYTPENATAVVNAQGPRGPVAISVRAGTVTLADLQFYSKKLGFPPLQDGTLTAPVLIWPEATLRLSPGERMALARDAGAFVLAMGTVDVNGATIEVAGPENAHTPSFVPFVTVANGGTLIVKNARIKGLGFGQTAKFSGLTVAGSLLTQDRGQVLIKDSFFDGLKQVSLAGVTGAEVSGNTFVNGRDNSLNLINAPKAQIENNLFTGDSPTNAVRVDKGSSQTRISRNMFFAGQRVAVLVMGQSDHVALNENLIWKRNGSGVKFLKTRCGSVTNTVILDNRQKGVEVRKSDGTVLESNLIAGSGSAGIWLSALRSGSQTLIRENVLVANSSGISTATAAEVLIDGNDLSGQLPRLLGGDTSRLSNFVARDLRGRKTLRLKNGSADQGIEMTQLCGSTF